MLSGRSVRPPLPIPSRTSLKIIGAVVGILAAAAPIILFNTWLKKQGDDEVAITAAWALGSAEIQLGQSITALEDLSARGIDSCGPAHVEAMRQAALTTGPVKQVMLIGSNGEVLCTDTGGAAGRTEVLASAAGGSPDIVFDVIRLADRRDRFLRIRKS